MGYSFNHTLMIFFLCLLVCGCDDTERKVKPKKQEINCKDKPLTVEMDGFVLNVPRSYNIKTSNENWGYVANNGEYCKTDHIKGVLSVGDFHMSITRVSSSTKEYIYKRYEKVKKSNLDITYLENGTIIHGDGKYYVLPLDAVPTGNNIPLIITCPDYKDKEHRFGGCTGYYQHSIGLNIRLYFNAARKFDSMRIEKTQKFSKKFENMIISKPDISEGEK